MASLVAGVQRRAAGGLPPSQRACLTSVPACLALLLQLTNAQLARVKSIKGADFTDVVLRKDVQAGLCKIAGGPPALELCSQAWGAYCLASLVARSAVCNAWCPPGGMFHPLPWPPSIRRPHQAGAAPKLVARQRTPNLPSQME